MGQSNSSTRYALDMFPDFEEEEDNVADEENNADDSSEDDCKMPARNDLGSRYTASTDESTDEDPASNAIDLTSPNNRLPIDVLSSDSENGDDEVDEDEEMDIEEEMFDEGQDIEEEDERKIPAETTVLDDSSEDEEDEVVHCWPCQRCTLLNSSARTICEACHLPRTSERRATSSRTHPPVVVPPFASRAVLDAAPTPSYSLRSSFATSRPGTSSTPTFASAQIAHQRAMEALEQQRRALEHQRRVLEQHRAFIRAQRPTNSERTALLLTAFGQSHRNHSTARLNMALAQYARHNNPDTMNYEQLLQAFGNGTENMGASDNDIDQLPVSTVNDPLSDLPQDHRTCHICLEDFASGDERRTLPCLHGYHKECADKWLKTNATCPVCKHSIRG